MNTSGSVSTDLDIRSTLSTDVSVPEANYSSLSEKFRSSTPGEIQCALFCGGRRCKYESERKWSSEQMAIPGIFSHWVTNDVLAMSRPSTDSIHKHNLIDKFKELGIKTIINLQEPGEHASCGPPLHSSGFSYDPSIFMENDIYFYNFQWRDYSSGDRDTLLDMVKVVSFATSEGKVAIHCHAGLGRTGVLISCYLILVYRCKPQEAIAYVRSKRPYAVQMRSQIECVYNFYQFIVPLQIVYPNARQKDTKFTLAKYLTRQRVLLHGYEARHLKHIPKIIYVICERLLQLCKHDSMPSPGVKRSVSDDSSSVFIDFRLGSSESFLNYFYATDKKHSSSFSSEFSGTSSAASSPSTRLTSSNRSGIQTGTKSNTAHSSTGTTYTDLSSKSRYGEDSPKSESPSGSEARQTNGVLAPVEETEGYGGLVRQSTMEYLLGLNDRGSTESPIESLQSTSSSAGPSGSRDGLKPDTAVNRRSSSCDINDLLKRASEIIEQESHERNDDIESSTGLTADQIAALLVNEYQVQTREFFVNFFRYQQDLNNSLSGWEKLAQESDVLVLSGLLWFWIESLKEPIIDTQKLVYIVIKAEKPVDALAKLEESSRFLIEYLVRFIARLNPQSEETFDLLMRRLAAAITHQMIRRPKSDTKENHVTDPGVSTAHSSDWIPGFREDWPEMRKGTTGRVVTFLKTFYGILTTHSRGSSS